MTNETPAVERLEGGSERPLCHYGSSTDRPCWREATETMFCEEKPNLCPEHLRAVEASHREEGLRYALDALEEWMRSKTAEADPTGDLERHGLIMRENILSEYALAVERAQAAHHVAQEGPPKPGEPSLTVEESLERTRRLIRSDAVTNARTMLEDTPEDKFGAHDKWVIVAALNAAARAAGEEYRRYHREGGAGSGS